MRSNKLREQYGAHMHVSEDTRLVGSGSSVDTPFLSAVKAETMLVRERRRAGLSLSTIIPTHALSLLLQVGLDSADHSL